MGRPHDGDEGKMLRRDDVLSRLTDEEREFWMMRYEMKLSNREVAQRLGDTSDNVSARYRRLLRKCRVLAKDDEG